jgi:anti-sigma factor RsiW
MCDAERLVAYLYDELSPDERAAFERHLAGCDACQSEVQGLRQTRVHLTSWAPPEPDFGFRIVRSDRPPAGTRRQWRGLHAAPAWGLAAAAALILAVSAAIANLEVRYGNDGLVVRTGWGRPAEPATGVAEPPAAVPVAATSEELVADLRSLNDRLRQLEQASAGTPTRAATGPRTSDAELIATVRRIIAESEARQENALKLRVSQLWSDMEAVRAGDIARVEQGLRQVQGLTDAELVRHRETLNYLYANVSRQR